MKSKYKAQIIASLVGLAGLVMSAKPAYQVSHPERYFPKVVPVKKLYSEQWRSEYELFKKIEICPYELLEDNESRINHYRDLATKLERAKAEYIKLLQDEETSAQFENLQSVREKRNTGFYLATIGLSTALGILSWRESNRGPCL